MWRFGSVVWHQCGMDGIGGLHLGRRSLAAARRPCKSCCVWAWGGVAALLRKVGTFTSACSSTSAWTTETACNEAMFATRKFLGSGEFVVISSVSDGLHEWASECAGRGRVVSPTCRTIRDGLKRP